MPLFVGERKYNRSTLYPYNCPFCDSSYARVQLVQEHMASIHAEDLKRYENEAKATISLAEDHAESSK